MTETHRRLREKLLRELGPVIGPALVEDGVVEIALNPNGSIWVEKMGHGFERRGAMLPQVAEALMGTIATWLNTTVTRESPILEGELPIDGSRFEGLLPPIVGNPTFTIRRKATAIFTLADYVRQDIMTAKQRDLIEAAVVTRQNILVVGGTGTGKTTLSNAIIHAISELTPDHRIVIIEDTSEIQCAAANVVPLHTTANVDMLHLLRATMRLKPDRIIVGEVRGGEAHALLKAWNTGHPGGLSTIHANNARGGLMRLEQLIAEVTSSPMRALVAAAVNMVVVIIKCPRRGRVVSEILEVTGYDSPSHSYLFAS